VPRILRWVTAALYLLVSLAVAYVLLASPIRLEDPGLLDLPVFLLVGAHLIWGALILVSAVRNREPRPGADRWFLLGPEILAVGALLYFLFSYIFAINANMDYVQRFIASGGDLRLAVDSAAERRLVWLRYFPLVGVNALAYFLHRATAYCATVAVISEHRQTNDPVVVPWALLLTLISAFCTAIALPSFIDSSGIPWLGWFAMVPLFLALRNARAGAAIFYGIAYGVMTALLSNYWLGTFNLVSLQIVVGGFLLYYFLLMPVTIALHRVSRMGRFLVFPLAWTVFEYLRSIGFLAYPWALTAHSQYTALPVIQVASITGVWGVSFMVLLANSALAEMAGTLLDRAAKPRESDSKVPPVPIRSAIAAAVVAVLVIGGAVGFGYMELRRPEPDPAGTVTIAQIQQNSDPRKHEFEETLHTLIELTNASLSGDIDLVVWPETAFVPSIGYWSTDPSEPDLYRLVHEFLEYQASIGTWLLTGNDDFEIDRAPDGNQVIRDYNSALLFNDAGRRVEAYRKIQLVPFTESFPYRRQLPRLYNLLRRFDIHLWEPGTDLTVFEHPAFRFATPICYEDIFPNLVRRFVTAGADVIVNISNDYWSLTDAQARQHFAAGLFRSVENRRPVLRTTTSGLTGQIDPYGRIEQILPTYEPAYLVSGVAVPEAQPETLYTRWGDYFPLAASGALVLLVLVSLLIPRRTVRVPLPEADVPDELVEYDGFHDTERGPDDVARAIAGEELDFDEWSELEPVEEGGASETGERQPAVGVEETGSGSVASPTVISAATGPEPDQVVELESTAESEKATMPGKTGKRRSTRKSRRATWKAIWDD
jgi:apolipoprotein N-acyltransferase